MQFGRKKKIPFTFVSLNDTSDSIICSNIVKALKKEILLSWFSLWSTDTFMKTVKNSHFSCLKKISKPNMNMKNVCEICFHYSSFIFVLLKYLGLNLKPCASVKLAPQFYNSFFLILDLLQSLCYVFNLPKYGCFFHCCNYFLWVWP